MKTMYRVLILSVTASSFQGCSNDNDFVAPPPPPPAMATFEVTVDNLTNAQPLSPAAVVAHQPGYSIFTVGAPASAGLEELAEGGDNAALLAEAGEAAIVLASASGGAPIGPAGSETLSFEVLESDVANLEISVATMLVNTNDAFSAISAVPISNLAVGDSWTATTIAYDAGTEANSEAATDIPGPAGGGGWSGHHGPGASPAALRRSLRTLMVRGVSSANARTCVP